VAKERVTWIVVVLFLVFVTIWSVRALPEWWAGRGRGTGTRRHRERQFLANTLALASMLAGVVVIVMIDRGWIGKIGGRILMTPVAAMFALSTVATLTIYWFNQPRFLVPPRMRRQPGRWREIRKR
jgi:hypothetical protein